MKLTIEKEELLSALKVAKTVLPKLSLQPILQTVYIKSISGGIDVICTDLINSIIYKATANIAEEGAICVPLLKLLAIVEKLEGLITFETNESMLVIKNNKTRYKMLTVNAEEYPECVINVPEDCYELEAKVLHSALSKVSYATAQHEGSVLSAVSMLCEDNCIELCATDGSRLALSLANYKGSAKKAQLLVPTAIKDVVKTASNDIKFAVEDGSLILVASNFLYRTRLIEGTYPRYRDILPKEFNKVVIVEKEALVKCLEKVAIMANERTNVVKIDITDGFLTAKADSDSNEAKDTIEINSDTAEPLSIAFNIKYMLECLKAGECGEVELSFKGSLSPCIVNSDYTGLLMPIQVK